MPIPKAGGQDYRVSNPRNASAYQLKDEENTMRVVTVYRMDYGRMIKDPVGVVLERRKTERTNNYNDLLRLAQRLFALDMEDATHIVIDVRQARQE